jgi:hypothetical protein
VDERGPTHPAQALTVYFQSGPSKDYVRDDEDGKTVWREAKTTFGRGAPHEPWPNRPGLTSADLAELLAASLE